MRHATRRKTGARLDGGRTGDLFAESAPRPGRAPAAAPIVPVPRSAPAPRHLWLALRLPELPLVALPAGARGPWAVAEDEGALRRIVAANAAARALGVETGLRLNAARMLAPALEACERNPVLERAELDRLARWAGSLTPVVSLEPPDGLLLEIQGSLRLFGGLSALLERARSGLEAHGHASSPGVAPTPRAALWLARGAPGTAIESAARLTGTLGRLPLGATGWSERTLEDCRRLGLATLGELRRLPRDGLRRRFEAGVLDELDEAFGQRPAPRRRHVAAERFRERVDLPAELEGAPALLPYCERLLERLGHFLRVRDAGVTAVAFTLLHREAKPSCVRLGRALPAGGGAEWAEFLAAQLERTTLPAPVRALVLRSAIVVPLAPASGDLAGLAARESQAQAFLLLDRLRARLGEAAVSGLGLVPEHRPEAAFRRVRPEPVPGRSAGAVQPLPAAARPLWLFHAPEPLALRAGRPVLEGPLALVSGPERIESGWWDGAGVARDYYVARASHGARLWIFRCRAGAEAGRWFLHGVFG